MNLLLKRHPSTDGATLGDLFIDGTFFCFTLEPDEDRPNHPAIPLGRYKVIVSYSTRFKRLLPLIVGVPGRLGIRIHPGNTEADTEGCILLGFKHDTNAVRISREACQDFQSRIAPVLARSESVWLQIEEVGTEAKSA